MSVWSPSSRHRGGSFGALVAALHLAVTAVVAPLLVLCEDGMHHSAVESVLALCCAPVHVEDAAPRPSATPAPAGDDCSGSCTDTPFLTNLDATAPKSVARAVAQYAVLSFAGSASSTSIVSAGEEAGRLRVLPSASVGRLSVLRI